MIYSAGIKHVARFWLKQPEDIAAVEEGVAQLATISQVLELVFGPPASTDWGRSIDKSWDVAFVASFQTLDDCRAYFECALHQRVAGELQALAERIEAFYVQF